MKASDQIAAQLPVETPKRKASSRRKPGLLHAMRAVQVEDVSVAMKKVCATCATRPKVRRLVVGSGGGRYGKEDVYCIKCGREKLALWAQEYDRAESFLMLGEIPMGKRVDAENGSEGIRL